MPVKLEGFIDDGRGEPLADIPAMVTILGTSTVVDTTITDAAGHWTFSGLPTADEYVVELTDTAGNAVARAPWSGQMRELYVRDRLEVVGKPVLVDPTAGNSLLWSATGLYAPTAPVTDLTNYYTKTEADARYEPLDSAYTKSEDDARFVNLAGGSVMTGLLGPTTHNTRDLGTTGTRWRALYGMTGDFTTSLTVATKPITPSPDAANIIEFRANGLYAAAGAVTDIWVNTTGDTMTGDLNMTANVLPTVTNVRSLGSTSLRWLKVWATDADFTNAPTVGGAALLTSTTADALFLTPAEGNAAYATAAHNHDTSYVQLAGGSVMTGLLGPTTTNTRDLGTTTLRWRKLWGVDADLSGVLGVTGAVTLTAGLTVGTSLSVNSRPVIMAGVRAYHNAAQTITTATTTVLAFNSERYDSDAFHDTVTNNSRLTVPAGLAGKYLCFVNVDWFATTDATWRLVSIRLNGVTHIGRTGGPSLTSASGNAQNVSVVYDLAAGDYIECVVRHERGSNLDINVSANFSPEFGMQRIG
jgi:hypothetical protein